jgi:hypothetical protein
VISRIGHTIAESAAAQRIRETRRPQGGMFRLAVGLAGVLP